MMEVVAKVFLERKGNEIERHSGAAKVYGEVSSNVFFLRDQGPTFVCNGK